MGRNHSGADLPVPETHGRLCLRRKEGTSIVIGEGPGVIVVTIDDLHGGAARISIVAPLSVKILRAELVNRTPKPKE